MKPPSFDRATSTGQLIVLPLRGIALGQGHDSADLLRRTQTTGDAPDRRYWTEYDYFMLEREARAKRREYVHGLIARGWRQLATRLARGRSGGAAEPQRT